MERLNLKKMNAAKFICKMRREWNFLRIGAERTGFHPGSVNKALKIWEGSDSLVYMHSEWAWERNRGNIVL